MIDTLFITSAVDTGRARTAPMVQWLGYTLDNLWSNSDTENFLFSTMLRLAFGPTQPHIQWMKGSFALGKTDGVWRWPLTSTLCGVLPLLTNMSSWCGHGQLYLLLDVGKWSVSCLKYIMPPHQWEMSTQSILAKRLVAPHSWSRK